MWELPEKISLPEDEFDETGATSHTLTPQPHSRHESVSLRRRSTGSLRTPPHPLSRGPTPPFQNNGSQLSVAAEPRSSKGKEKEVINTGLDGDRDTSGSSTSDDTKGNEAETTTSPEPEAEAEPSRPISKPRARPSKTSFHEKFRQLWSTRSRDKSSDKIEPV
ncbi:hypothetical protein RRF57_000059 [Xylaria bambusicola]|uniref:Uncharacterized protein n=1 Tax=Xylaria bambusicola TaxID=326684 RepID=A0AAN7U9K4_9PEZI